MVSQTAKDRAWGALGAYRLNLEREAIARPGAPLAQKMFSPLNQKLLADHKRGAVSPLGGVAQSKGRGG